MHQALWDIHPIRNATTVFIAARPKAIDQPAINPPSRPRDNMEPFSRPSITISTTRAKIRGSQVLFGQACWFKTVFFAKVLNFLLTSLCSFSPQEHLVVTYPCLGTQIRQRLLKYVADS